MQEKAIMQKRERYREWKEWERERERTRERDKESGRSWRERNES